MNVTIVLDTRDPKDRASLLSLVLAMLEPTEVAKSVLLGPAPVEAAPAKPAPAPAKPAPAPAKPAPAVEERAEPQSPPEAAQVAPGGSQAGPQHEPEVAARAAKPAGKKTKAAPAPNGKAPNEMNGDELMDAIRDRMTTYAELTSPTSSATHLRSELGYPLVTAIPPAKRVAVLQSFDDLISKVQRS